MRKKATEKKETYIRAYLTVYISLSLSVLLSLCLTLIEGARSGAVRMETECIMDIGMNSILAEYHRVLSEEFNLFFIDTSYGTALPSNERTAAHLRKYLERNTDVGQVFLGDFWYRDFLNMKVKDTKVTRLSLATDFSGEVFRRRAMEAVRDDVGLTFLQEVADWMKTVEAEALLDWDTGEEKEEVDAKIQEYNGSEKKISEKEWITIEVTNPTEELEKLRSVGILNLVLEDTDKLSRMAVDTSCLISRRRQRAEINAGNWAEEGDGEGIMDKLLFQEYLMRYLTRFGGEIQRDSLQYQLEYLIAGKSSDSDNLKSVVYRISALREAANAVYLFSDGAKCAEAEALAALLSAAMLLPEIEPLLKVSLILGWAYAESLYDVKCLLAGEKIPLLKDAESWHYDIGCIFESNGEETARGAERGQEYTDYLRILLAFTDLDTLTWRAMDMIEADVRQTPGNGAFRMDACADRVEASAVITGGRGGTYTIVRAKEY